MSSWVVDEGDWPTVRYETRWNVHTDDTCSYIQCMLRCFVALYQRRGWDGGGGLKRDSSCVTIDRNCYCHDSKPACRLYMLLHFPFFNISGPSVLIIHVINLCIIYDIRQTTLTVKNCCPQNLLTYQSV